MRCMEHQKEELSKKHYTQTHHRASELVKHKPVTSDNVSQLYIPHHRLEGMLRYSPKKTREHPERSNSPYISERSGLL